MSYLQRQTPCLFHSGKIHVLFRLTKPMS